MKNRPSYCYCLLLPGRHIFLGWGDAGRHTFNYFLALPFNMYHHSGHDYWWRPALQTYRLQRELSGVEAADGFGGPTPGSRSPQSHVIRLGDRTRWPYTWVPVPSITFDTVGRPYRVAMVPCSSNTIKKLVTQRTTVQQYRVDMVPN